MKPQNIIIGIMSEYRKSNIRIYLITLTVNFLFGNAAVFALNLSSELINTEGNVMTAGNNAAIIITFVMPIIFIIINFHCFKFCKLNKVVKPNKLLKYKVIAFGEEFIGDKHWC